MKKINILLIAVSLMAATSCDLDKITSLQDEFKININPDAVVSKMEIHVINAKSDSDTPINAVLTFSGDQASNVFTTDGKRTFDVNDGFINVGLKRTVLLSEEAPESITVKVVADGFVTKELELFFNGVNTQSISIPLMEKGNLPSGTTLVSSTETLVGNATVRMISILVEEDDAEDGAGVEFEIPAGTSFFDENGNPLIGSEVVLDFQTFSTETPTDEEILNAPVDENGELSFDVINELPIDFGIDDSQTVSKSLANKTASITADLIPLNYLGCFYLYVNGRKVYRVNKPTIVRNYLNNYYLSRAINPKTGNPPAVGDEVEVFFYDWYTRKKEFVSKVVIQESGSKKYVEFLASKPGLYPVGFRKPNICPDPVTQPINFVNNGLDTWYYYRVRSKNSYYGSGWGCMYISGSKKIYPNELNYWGYRGFKRLTGDMILTIYNYEKSNRKWNIAYNKEISICDLANGVAVDISNKDCGTPKDIDFRISCDNANYSLNYTGVYYKETSSSNYYNWWGRYGSVINGRLQGNFPCLDDNKEYIFGFYYGKWRTTPGILGKDINDIYSSLDIDNVCKLIEENK